jgi:coenzyme F420-reducing hydrogenase beta subunit
VLEELDGYVAGVAFDEQFMPVHRLVNSYEDAKEFRNSKYAQSDSGAVYSQILALLKQGKTVLYIGTPCQSAGLISYLSRKFDNLITVDLVCRSIPSPVLWRCYLDWQQERFASPISRVTCRTKAYGYHSGALEIEFANGKRYRGSNRVDYYMKSFHGDICSRPSCYDCKFKTKHHCTDFTAFDCWRPQLVTDPPLTDDDRGYTNVLIHTEKGRRLMDEMKHIKQYPADPEKLLSVMGSMIGTSIRYKKERGTFYRDLRGLGFYNTAKNFSVTKQMTLTGNLVNVFWTETVGKG